MYIIIFIIIIILFLIKKSNNLLPVNNNLNINEDENNDKLNYNFNYNSINNSNINDPYLLGLNSDIERFVETKKRFNYNYNYETIGIDNPFGEDIHFNKPNDQTIKDTYDNLILDYKKINEQKEIINNKDYITKYKNESLLNDGNLGNGIFANDINNNYSLI